MLLPEDYLEKVKAFELVPNGRARAAIVAFKMPAHRSTSKRKEKSKHEAHPTHPEAQKNKTKKDVESKLNQKKSTYSTPTKQKNICSLPKEQNERKHRLISASLVEPPKTASRLPCRGHPRDPRARLRALGLRA